VYVCLCNFLIQNISFLFIEILCCFRYTDRRKSAVHHFKQALSVDPLMWAAYEELCVLGLYKEFPHGPSS
jgi:hypothetical protein